MLKSCSYCGRIHPKNYQCPKKPIRKRFDRTDADKFRKTSRWTKKSIEIRKRDKGLCVLCLRNLYDTQKQYTFENIEVHHIVPLHENISKGLNNNNLISVCAYHHKRCEPDGDIPRNIQLEIAKEQEKLNKF